MKLWLGGQRIYSQNRPWRSQATTAAWLVLAAGASFGSPAAADERLFTYSYEPKVLPKGALEFEQWATLRAGKQDGVFSRWDLRSEFEHGLTDSLTTALYLNFKSLHVDRDNQQESEFEFEGLSSEWKWKLTDPTADPLGTLLYGEVSTNFNEVELEEKLVLGKEIDDVVLAFNAILEEEWEFENEETEKELVLEFTAGAAYRLAPNVALGVELREVNVYEDMSDLEGAAFFAGPVIHYSAERWWVTLTLLPQIVALKGTTGDSVNLDEFERAQARVIVGIHF
jgi:hypothetical protein